ncbi:MAG: hypothetical protein Q9208_008615 [Pyrenodesmia sp. 3 TL-2023]
MTARIVPCRILFRFAISDTVQQPWENLGRAGHKMIRHLLALATCLALASCLPPPQATAIYSPKCWKPGQRLIQPAVFRECLAVINRITSIRDPDEVLKFSPDAAQRPDVEVPVLWSSRGNGCNIGLQFDRLSRERYDRTTLNDIRSAALATAIHCVIQPPHLGGVVVVGFYKHLVVNVLSTALPGPPGIRENGTVLIE